MTEPIPLSPQAEALVSAWLRAQPEARLEIGTDLLVRYLSGELPREGALQVEAACTADPSLRRRLLATNRELKVLRAASWADLEGESTPDTDVRRAWTAVLRERIQVLARAGTAWSEGWEQLRQRAAVGAAEARAGIHALREALAAQLESPAPVALTRSGTAGLEAELDPAGALSVRAATSAPDGTPFRLLIAVGGAEWSLGTARAGSGTVTWRFEGFADLFGRAAERLDQSRFVVRETEAEVPTERVTIWAEIRGGGSTPRRVALEATSPVRWDNGKCRLTLTAEPEVRRQIEGRLLVVELCLAPGVTQLLGTHFISQWPESGCDVSIPCPGAPDRLLPFLPLLHLTFRPPGLP